MRRANRVSPRADRKEMCVKEREREGGKERERSLMKILRCLALVAVRLICYHDRLGITWTFVGIA